LLGILSKQYEDSHKLLSYIASTLMMLGSAGVTAAIFQVIIKSTAFMNVLKDTLDIDKRNWKKYNDSKIKDVLNAIAKAKKFVKISYIDEKEKSIKSAKKALIRMQKEIEEKAKKSDDDLNILNKNYILEESRITKTILKNGSEITTFELDIRFFKKGKFIFNMENWTDSEKIKYPKFDIFKNAACDKRFHDFSFFAVYFNLKKKDIKINKDRYALLNIDASDFEKENGFKVNFTIEDTFEVNDFFTLSFSTTIKDTYTEENIKRIQEGKDPRPHSSTRAPVGVRKITIQEEIYGNEEHQARIRPTLNIDSNYIDPTIEEQSIFYKKYHWTIYYSENQYETIGYSVI